MTMRMGADYYPEHWERERWETDAGLMKEIGFNTVRMAEFAWSKMEKRRGEFHFEWLDDAIETLGKEDIRVVLCTPTATPPKWLCDEKDICQRDGYGMKRDFGSRRHYCYNNTDYHAETERIVTEMIKHYKNNPSVIAWQIDNEFGCHETTRCYCSHCSRMFKKWLESKYETIEKLNEEWGLVFWGQTFNRFEEVELPTYTVMENPNKREFPHNPGLLLDFARFSSESAVRYQKFQIDLLRKNGCQVPITHNLMGHAPDIDYYQLSKDLDFVCWDNYPLFPFQKNKYRVDAMAHDLMRSVRHENFWVMEHQSGPGGTCASGDTPKPGQIRLWTFASLAHGAKAIIYFRWRACLFGNEEYWHGVLDHDGIPRRRYREIQWINQELGKIGKIFEEGQNAVETAIVKSYDNLWSDNFQWHNPKFNYDAFLMSYYNGLIDNNVNCDIIDVFESFDAYKLVFLPAVSLVTEEIYKKIERYAANGGTVVLTFRSGIKEWNNSMTPLTLPGYFKELAGIELIEYDSLNTDRQNYFRGVFGAGTINMWCDIINARKTEVLASYSSDYYDQTPCITRNRYGKGQVYYVGCDMDAAAQIRFTDLVLKQSGVSCLNESTCDGVEFIKKIYNEQSYIIVLNHNNAPVTLPLSFAGTERLTGVETNGVLTLEHFGAAVIQVLDKEEEQ